MPVSINVRGSCANGYSARVEGPFGLRWTGTRPTREGAIEDARDLLSRASVPDAELAELRVNNGTRLGEFAGVRW